MHVNRLSLTCICCGLVLLGSGVWTWFELQSWLARSDVLTPFVSLGLSRFLNVVLYASGTFLSLLLLSLLAVYRACRDDTRRGDAEPQSPERLITRRIRAY
jgi:membrane protein implicated in regulation of membrane protease activity